MSENNYDVIIIGGGPAGLTAAVYTSRASLSTLVLAGQLPGGQLTTTTEVENFPGFPEGIMGPELVANMRKQAERFECDFVNTDVDNIDNSSEGGYVVKTIEGNIYKGRSVIISTGASAKWLGLESEQKLRGRGVSACATCDGPFFRNKTVAVVGGGDAAMEESLFLTRYCEKVYVLVRGVKEKLRASKIMQERAFENHKIEFLFNTEVSEVLGDSMVSGVRIINNSTNEEKILSEVSGLFLAIGHMPNTDFIKDFVDLDEKNYISVTDNVKTSKKGVFAAGDVADYKYRQAITASGLGCMAALEAEKYLLHN